MNKFFEYNKILKKIYYNSIIINIIILIFIIIIILINQLYWCNKTIKFIIFINIYIL